MLQFTRLACAIALLCCLQTPVLHAAPPDSPFPSASSPTMALSVDATEAPRRILHARLYIPAHAGPLTLVYPKWIPGEHGPTGPIDNLAGLVFTANGQPVPWHRDLQDMYAFHCDVPRGANALEVTLDFLLSGDQSGFSASGLTTPNLVNINWNQLLLYPQGRKADDINVQASLRLPSDWHYGTALPVIGQTADVTRFAPVPLVTLIDSPVVAGLYFKAVPLTAPGVVPAHEIDMVSDSDAALEMPEGQVQSYRNLVAETGALFGARHYRDYHFLYTLSDHVASFGLEHHESSDDRMGERTLLEEPKRGSGDLLPHEFVHSWNGKYRRPYDLYTPDYQAPMQTDLLWVYEGLTEYYGKVLTSRCGLWTPDDFQDNIASLAAVLDHRVGRVWRPLQDTADAAQLLYNTGNEWQMYRRGTDFYDEMVLIWLEADTTIRQQTHGARSLDDFCRRFYGPPSTPPLVKTYTFDDVVKTLNDVTPYDWRGFLQTRLNRTGTGAPLGGIVNSGWKLVYTDTESDQGKSEEGRDHFTDLGWSLGLLLGDEGGIVDVIPGMPGAAAGLGPGMKIVAVNGRAFSKDGLLEALTAGKSTAAPLLLLIQNGGFYKTYSIGYHGGSQYPHLVRDMASPDLLSVIGKALIAPPPAAAPSPTAAPAPAAATPPATAPPPVSGASSGAAPHQP